MTAMLPFLPCFFLATTAEVSHSILPGCEDPANLGEKINNHKEVFLPPASTQNHSLWLSTITKWRERCRRQIGYNGSIYRVQQLKWARYNFVQPQMHPWDRMFFNDTTQQYTVQVYLEDVKRRYGGVDSVLMWPTYPLLGLDDRNQFDLFASLPGGIEGLRSVVTELHRAGVQVLFPFLAWDNFTRPDTSRRTDATRMAALIADTLADGANADSAKTDDNNTDSAFHMTREFYDATVTAGRPAAWQAENGPSAQTPTALNWQVMDIGYWGGMTGNYTGGGGGSWSFAPAVDKWKWMDTRRVTVVSDRWATNKTNNLQHAYFNAVGYEAWENIWGAWNGITPRDGETLRRMSNILRFFSRLGFTQSAAWEPHTPMLQNATVFGSKWPKGNETLWTIVNRGPYNTSGAQMQLREADFGHADLRFFDCYHGAEIRPSAHDGGLQLDFPVEALGLGCVFATPEPSTAFRTFLEQMAAMTGTALASFSSAFEVLTQTMVVRPRVTRGSSTRMVRIPAGEYNFIAAGVEIEGNEKVGTDVQFEWEDMPIRYHERRLNMTTFLIDKFPVTCADYQRYIVATGYRPRDPHRWLANWDRTFPGSMPALPSRLANVPVTYVSLSEAAAYCAALGKRLPSTVEWQYAAQGTSDRAYPWGDDDDPRCRPDLQHGRRLPDAAPVDAYADKCSSVFNVSDLVGNTWEYTSVFVDAHTRRVVLKGGSNYKPAYHPQPPNYNRHNWYFPQTRDNLTQHNAMFLMSDSFERAGTVGFRCARDIDSPENE